MSDDCCSSKGRDLEKLAQQANQRRVLIVVLAINALMFAVEFGAGVAAGSASLMADSVDMLGDALVYGLSIYAISRSNRWKAGAATVKGMFILGFGLAVLVQVGFKVAYGIPPSSIIMLIFGGLALAANLICLRLLWRFRNHDLNMSSTFECSRNDVIANVGVLVAATLVGVFSSPWPDVIVAAVIALMFLRSSASVLRSTLPELRTAKT